MAKHLQALSFFIVGIFALATQIHISYATPSYRGFQIPLEAITSESLDDIISNWGANELRIQIGNNTEMDGTIGAAYDAMMEEQFSLLDTKLPLIESKGLTIIFCLYSPPGGFETRTAPSHYQMFSDPSLQDAFIAKWEEIIIRYGSNPTITAFDLVNEPAANKSLMGEGVRSWNTLLLDTIAAIRAINPSKTLIVKSLYGDPSKLGQLPAIDDSNIMYSYNSYFYSAYQHSGVFNDPFSANRPSSDRILKSMRRRLSPFFFKMYNRMKKNLIPNDAFPPKLVVGEATVSSCALEAGTFLSDLLSAIETDDSELGERKRNRALRKWRKKRRRNRRRGISNRGLKKPSFDKSDFILDVQHYSYAIHAYGEAKVWDPRYSCSSDGEFTFESEDTDRAIVIKSFMSRNSL
jgi:hypothetical protein